MAETPPTPKPGFRPDIDALRAVAIVLVVLYHAHVPWLSGGFIGVDVFFVISGYLITRNLLAEREHSGRIALGAFWARRLRRLVPAMSVMVAVTMALGLVVLVPLQWNELAAQGIAASVYVANLHFAEQSSNYFAAGVDGAPLLHTWSLAVEEQFYLVWPVLIGLVLAVAPKLRRPTVAIVTVLSALAVASFALSTNMVARGNSLAFYGLPARSWEFAVAGLLAVATTRWTPRLPTWLALAMTAGGLATLVVVAHRYDATTAFPGWSALPPVLATAAIIAAGSWSMAPWRLASEPLRWIGRVSYSWYLWHWPAMVLSAAWLERDTVPVRLAAGVVSLGIATASLRWLEDPVRRAPRLVRSGWSTAAMAVVFTVVAIGAAVGVNVRHDQVLNGSFHRAIADAASKRYLDNCTWTTNDRDAKICELGDRSSDRTMIVSGDSHAMSWAPSFDLAGKDMGLKVLVRSGNSCPGAPVPTLSDFTGKVNQSCMDYRAETRRIIDDVDPELVVLVSSDFTRRVADANGVRVDDRLEQLEVWADALRQMRDDLAADGITLGAILDNPRIVPDPLLCMEQTEDLEGCGADRKQALRRVRLHVANEAEALGPDATLDTIDMVCDDLRCHIWRDGQYVFADPSHLSAGFTEAHADDLADFLTQLQAIE